MKSLQRLPEPQVLIDRKQIWLDNFIASGKTRPDSSKYAHPTIKRDLNSISSYKCFYCETKLKDQPKEVDHHIEVSVDKRKAYDWENLYLACDNCNGKVAHNIIPVADTLNPFNNTDDEIRQHITFNKELIEPSGNSGLGLRTIKKYRLDTELLDTRRLKQISLFQDLLLVIRENQINELRQGLNQDEINAINAFRREDNPYSLMFNVLIQKSNLIN